AATLEQIGEDIDTASVYTTQSEMTAETHSTGVEESDGLKLNETIDPPNSVARDSPLFVYGVSSNRIGEACASFLAKWGYDLLVDEEGQGYVQSPSPSIPHSSGDIHRPTMNRHSSFTTSWRLTSSPPRIWSEGLSPEWVRGIISSDEFFVKSELQRYDVAKRVVEMRRRLRGAQEAEEREWRQLFEDGIYYSHLTWEELLKISEDRSPSTNEPYVPSSCLQRALWSFNKLRSQIMKSGSSTSMSDLVSSGPRKGLQLGFASTFSELPVISTNDSPGKDSPLWPVPADTSLRIGDPGETAIADISTNLSEPRDKWGHRPLSVDNFFGIGHPKTTRERIAVKLSADGANTSTKWVPYEPFRFSVEFWGINSLKEKTRLYSHTMWYAGSCYNVYTQAVRKKGLQLGIYLHRQSNVDPIPAASAPRISSPRSGPLVWSSSLPQPISPVSTHTIISPVSRPHARSIPTSEPSDSRGHTAAPLSRSPPLRSSTPVAVQQQPRYMHSNASFSPSSPSAMHSPAPQPLTEFAINDSQTSSNAVPPHQPYRDPRPAISAYFSVGCHSASGSISQSWGWKSSSLSIGESADQQSTQEATLRATVVIGLV
ncbi:17070_t:CDS:2, partial [Acaulospora colombiana]